VRILYFADIRFPLERANGIQSMETCHALASRGHDVHMIVRPDSRIPARDPFVFYGSMALERLRIERVPSPTHTPSRRLAYLAFATGRVVRRCADAVLTRDLGVASVLLRVPRRLRPRLVYESHGYSPDVAAAMPDLLASARRASPAKLRRLERREARVWSTADGYVTITRALADDLRDRFGDRPRSAVIPDGVRLRSPRQWTTPCLEPRSTPVVAYAGHLYPWKGVDVLLHALARVPHVRGMIIGGHEPELDLARLTHLAAQLAISDRVTFTGFVAPHDVPRLLAATSILVLPNPASAISTRFTSPLKLFEYMAAGRPIVASDLPAVREVLQHEMNALLVEPGNAAAIAAAIQRLIADAALSARLARAAFDAAEQYSWEKRAERLEALIQEVLR
jgi:glycosyltransferase involved in cell wall biosynthesis